MHTVPSPADSGGRRPIVKSFTPTQQAIYDEVKAAGTLDRQLMALSDVAARPDTDPADILTVRKWLSDLVIRESAR